MGRGGLQRSKRVEIGHELDIIIDAVKTGDELWRYAAFDAPEAGLALPGKGLD